MKTAKVSITFCGITQLIEAPYIIFRGFKCFKSFECFKSCDTVGILMFHSGERALRESLRGVAAHS